jgi:ribonuclease VapC
MVIDTSAIVAALLKEPGHVRVVAAITSASTAVIAAPTRVELSVVLHRRLSRADERRAHTWLAQTGVETVPFDADHAEIAAQAYRDFGRGSGHPARLNYGDCFSYALAISRDEPLLFVGDDFTHTDVKVALKR